MRLFAIPPALATSTLLLHSAPAAASSFYGRLFAGPGYLSTDAVGSGSDQSGPALLTQLDAGVRLLAPLAVHATLLYDYSSWLDLGPDGGDTYPGSVLGLGLGVTASVIGIQLGASAGGQFTWFTSNDDPASGPNGASLGPFIAANAGYVFPLALGTSLGVHVLGRYRSAKDETVSITYDPKGYELGLALSIGFDGEPLLGP